MRITKLGVGLSVAFLVCVVLSLAAQAQVCKYVGPADPLELNTVSYYNPAGAADSATVKTVKSQKEVFYCYKTEKQVPDDKTLQDPIANRDKITAGLVKIVEIKIFAIIVEWSFSPTSPHGLATTRGFRAIRCEKQPMSGVGTTNDTWVVTGCTTYTDGHFGTLEGEQLLPQIPAAIARKCIAFGKSPYTGGPIPIEDPTAMNTVTIDYDNDGEVDLIKTVTVNKEVFRCFGDGLASIPTIYDIELYYEELEGVLDEEPGVEVTDSSLSVAYCAKKEKEALLLGCSWKELGQNPFTPVKGAGLPAELRPMITLQATQMHPRLGQFQFVAQGYNIASVQVTVYNLRGQPIYTGEAAGNALKWTPLDAVGRRLANGVYLYVIRVKGTYGDVLTTKVQKFALLN